MKAMEADISDESRLFKEVDSRNVVILYDGMALVHKLIKSFTAAKTFGDISKIVLATILKVPDELKHLEDMENVRIDLVMDRYSMSSVKDPERNNRTGRKGNAALSALPTVVTGPEQPIPADFSAFLELNSNKKEFVQFLGKQLSAEAPQMLHENQILVVGGAIDG